MWVVTTGFDGRRNASALVVVRLSRHGLWSIGVWKCVAAGWVLALVQVAGDRGRTESELLAEPKGGNEPVLNSVVEPALLDLQQRADIVGGKERFDGRYLGHGS